MDLIEKIIDKFEASNVKEMHFDTWQYKIEKTDAPKFENKGYELIYNGFNSHDCCSQYTIKRII